MNLWAKHIRQLAFLPVALFFFSCEDEASLLGYKNPNTKFEVRYVEIPLESSVLLLDSQRTSNFLFSGETNRLMVGSYVDEHFGTITSTAISQYFTTTGAKLAADATYDSAVLQLDLDYYYYGSKQSSEMGISVYEIEEELSKGLRNYFNTSEVAIGATPIGSKNFIAEPVKFEEYLKLLSDSDSQNDSAVLKVTVNIPLDYTFGQRIFEKAVGYSASETDTLFVTPSLFTAEFKGLALKSNVADKIIGINPTSNSSAIKLHYHTAATDSLSLNIGFFNVVGFNQIKSERTGTALNDLTQFSQDFYPATEDRYIQSGTSVYTKLDFSNFFAFADTVPNVLINSAQLVIESVMEGGDNALPLRLQLRLLDNNNLVEKYDPSKNKQDSVDFVFYNPRQHAAYPGSIGIDNGSVGDNDNAFFALGDQIPALEYVTSTKSFSGNFSLFFQQLAVLNTNKTRFQSAILYPVSPAKPGAKALNRTVFPQSGIKLRVYYTKPTVPLN